MNGSELFKQSEWLPLPDNCRLAPDTYEIRKNVLRTNLWSADSIILASGNQYET